MSRSQKKTADRSKPAPGAGTKKRYRLEVTLGQILMCSFCLLVVLGWMFVFGILVGRGLPLAETQKAGLGNEMMHFIGLAGQSTATPPNETATLTKSQQMLNSLNYDQILTRKPSASASNLRAAVPVPAAASPPTTIPDTTAKSANSAAPSASQSDAAAQTANTHFTLLVASLKDQDNARRFVAQLKSRGYAASMEIVDMPDSGRWYRVLVGSFDTRDQALQFAAEFNEKEHQQALVIELDS